MLTRVPGWCGDKRGCVLMFWGQECWLSELTSEMCSRPKGQHTDSKGYPRGAQLDSQAMAHSMELEGVELPPPEHSMG